MNSGWKRGVALMLPAIILAGLAAVTTPHAAAQTTPANLEQMKADYRRPAGRPAEDRALVDLGRQLFWDPRISASGTTMCASCHIPYLGWGVTEPRSRNDSGKLTARKSQPLIGIGHMANAAVGWDGRNASLEAQAKGSIATGAMSMQDTAMPVKAEVVEQRIRDIPAYGEMFKAVFPDGAITLNTIARAIAAFERTMEPGVAPFDRWIDGDEGAISESAKRGFVLFNTKTTCFACHTGWRFTDDKFHDIGTSKADIGRGRAVKDDPMAQYAFKTPTLRSVALRPPYMHNASQASLYDVLLHYEKEPIDRRSRSPLFVPVTLSEQERNDLVALMQTLTGVPEGEPAPKLPASK